MFPEYSPEYPQITHIIYTEYTQNVLRIFTKYTSIFQKYTQNMHRPSAQHVHTYVVMNSRDLLANKQTAGTY